MKTTISRIILVIAAIVLVAGLLVAFVPGIRNTVTGWFSSNTSSVEETTPTEGTDATDPTEDTVVTDPTVIPEEEEDVLERPFTFEEFVKLATTNGMWNVAPEGALLHDLTDDEFIAESEEEQNEFAAVMLRVNPYGAMSIMQVGFENKENHVGETVAPVFTLCDCKLHVESFNEDMGQFHWHVAEGNEALGATSWTRMSGELQEVLLTAEEREVIRAAAAYWFVEDENGQSTIVYGIRVCGDQKDPEPPVVEPEKETYTVTYKFSNNNLPQAVLNLLPAAKNVEEGTKVTSPSIQSTVKVEGGTWTFNGWDKKEVTVTGNVTVTGSWSYKAEEGEGGEEKQEYTVTYKFSGNNLPTEVKNLLPAAKTVEEGTKVTSPSIQSTVKVSGGTWTFNGWDKKEVTVTGNVTVTGSWTYTAEEQPPVVKEYTVSYKFVGSKGESLPQEVLNRLPASTTVKEGTIVTPRNLSGVEIEVPNGTWKFQGWDKNSATVNGDTTFTGSWKYVEKLSLADPIVDYNVNFRFVSATSGKSLPASVTSLKPATIVAQKGETVNAPSINPVVEVSGGTWVFNGWSSNSITVVSDATITGTWTFEKTPEPEHTPTEDEDPNPVAENQDELNELGERTDEVEENTPEHSERENLSLMPADEASETETNDQNGTNDGINNQHSNVEGEARTDIEEEEEEENQSANNGLSLMPTEGEADSAEGGESDDLTLSLDLPVDDSEVADQETQDELNAMFGDRE